MAKKMAFLTVIFVLILSVISGCNGENIGKDDGEAIEKSNEKTNVKPIKINNGNDEIIINAEVVDKPADMEKGLMFRESPGENEGMLFVFEEEGKYSFWMKNTLIPLDMIFIDAGGKIVGIESAVPCEKDQCPTYDPAENHLYVLEANGGFAEKNGIRIGDMINLKEAQNQEPNTIPSEPESMTQGLCESANGYWNECGSACAGTGADFCIQMCVTQCECGGIAGFGCPAGYECGLSGKIADEMGVCIDGKK